MPFEHLSSARILIVDDHPANVALLVKLLQREGFGAVEGTTDPREVPGMVEASQPDLLLVDMRMPHLDGVALIERIRAQLPPNTYLPILVLTADSSPQAMQDALSAGAMDFLTKPFDRIEVLLRIRNLLETRMLYRRLDTINERLEEMVAERTQELAVARNETLERLALAAEHRDDATAEHVRRVGTMSGLVAAGLGLDRRDVDLITRAAPLHDVGKIGVSDGILLKPGPLTPEEWVHIRAHPDIGARILGASGVPVLQMAEQIARSHHEKWDGTGYPGGLRGPDIPLSGRIVAVADVFDALTHERPYKDAWPADRAIEEIVAQSGRHFDPDVVSCFLGSVETALVTGNGHGLAAGLNASANGHHRSRRPSRKTTAG